MRQATFIDLWFRVAHQVQPLLGHQRAGHAGRYAQAVEETLVVLGEQGGIVAVVRPGGICIFLLMPYSLSLDIH